MKKENKDANILGAGQVKISFGRGTIEQAYEDRTIGGINYGRGSNDEFNDVDAGAVFIEGKLFSSRVLDMTISRLENGANNIEVCYLDSDNAIARKSYESVDKTLVDSLIAAAIADVSQAPVVGSEYIDVSTNEEGERVVSVKFNELYAQILAELDNDRFGDLSGRIDALDASVGEAIAEHTADVSANISRIDDDIELLQIELDKKADKGFEIDWKDVRDLLD